MTSQTTRRALIGGAGLAGVALFAPALAVAHAPAMAAKPASNRVGWNIAMQHYETSLAIANAADENHEGFDEAWEVHCDAQRALMDMPAPGRAKLLWKIDKLFDDDGDTVAWCAGYCDQLHADARRMLGGDA